MRRLLAAFCLGAAAAAPASAEPGDDIGSTVKVVNLVTAEFNKDTRSLTTGDGVRQDELIAVGSDALGELRFMDQTKLALGPGSQLRLDKFVYDPDKTGASIAIDLVKGTFRFITGLAPKPSYVVKTPSAAITVRGTVFDLYIDDAGMTWVLLLEGAVKACNSRGKCRELDEPGKVMRVGDDGEVGIPVRWAGLKGADGIPFDLAFPFFATPPSIDPKPALTREAVLTEEKEEPQKKTKKPRKAEKKKDDDKPKPTKRASTKEKKKTKTTKASPKIDSGKVVDGIGLAIGIAGGIKIGGGKKPGGGNKPPGRGSGSGGGNDKHPRGTPSPYNKY